jgi:hypothetical protein
VPSFVGSGDLTLFAALSVAGTKPRASVTALALSGDALLVGFCDGTAALWRCGGLSVFESLVAPPSARARPDALFAGAAAGAVVAAALSADDDAAVLCFDGEAWLFEASRARPLARLVNERMENG